MTEFNLIRFLQLPLNLLGSLLFVLLILISCKENEVKGDLIAEVGDAKLYSTDVYFLNYSTKDSAAIVSNYVNDWVAKEALVLEAKNDALIDQIEIERKVAQFESDLLIHELVNNRVKEALDTNITEAEISQYFSEHQDDFQLNDYLVKVLYLKVPFDAPDMEEIGTAYRLRNGQEDLDIVANYAKTYASNFYYDIESWIYFDDLLKEIPLQDINKDRFILKRSKIRFEESGFYYFLNIVDYKLKNTISPLTFERENIKARIINLRIKNLKEEIKNTIIKEAHEAQKIKLY